MSTDAHFDRMRAAARWIACRGSGHRCVALAPMWRSGVDPEPTKPAYRVKAWRMPDEDLPPHYIVIQRFMKGFARERFAAFVNPR